jgi:prepilin-type N-terminal cleavage/methylation domain-containing protein/prepilin-type processing-associated H-X9-DG protein
MKFQTLRQKFRNPRGFTLTELLVVITMIAVLALISSMGASRIRDASRRAASMGNLKQLGVGMMSFTLDNNGFLPQSRRSSVYWPAVIHPYVSTEVFLRPGSKDVPASATQPEGYFAGVSAATAEGVTIRWNYIINGGGANLPFYEAPASEMNQDNARGYARSYSSIESPSQTIFMAEGKENNWWFNLVGAIADSPRIYRWKNGTSNVLFADGSTRNVNPRTEIRASDFLVLKPRT